MDYQGRNNFGNVICIKLKEEKKDKESYWLRNTKYNKHTEKNSNVSVL